MTPFQGQILRSAANNRVCGHASTCGHAPTFPTYHRHFSVAKVALIVHNMSVSMLQGGFEPILKYKLRAPSDWGRWNVKFHDSMYTTPFSRTQTNALSMVSSSTIMYICKIAYDDYSIGPRPIIMCLCSLPSMGQLCCAFTYVPHLSTTPFNAKWHYLQCNYSNFLPRLIFSLSKRDFAWQYYWLLLYINATCH